MLRENRTRGVDRRRGPFQELEPEVRLSVVGGVAYLEGGVSCYERKKILAALVADLPSVERVVNRLRVVPGSPRSDHTIEEAVLAALKIDPVLQLQNVSVKVADGVVELRGTVPSIAARIAAETAAWSACGVRHVDNRLDIAPGAPVEPADPGEELRSGLRWALGDRAAWVELAFEKGVVHLWGDVPSAEDRLAAEDWVRWHPMVRKVVNRLPVLEENPLSSLGQSA